MPPTAQGRQRLAEQQGAPVSARPGHCQSVVQDDDEDTQEQCDATLGSRSGGRVHEHDGRACRLAHEDVRCAHFRPRTVEPLHPRREPTLTPMQARKPWLLTNSSPR
jgi:hypothetical protein